ncbi:putative integral membrane protein (TIGR02587 family) [Brevundimonas alba]|uniref:Putative integral membrane protein (TIGR02587 family) n=1 Tax=Brevundimonas alba TaxID=74314 RepID=A0A7X5YM28_9CAUL|nr:TIGR02587 family membrane protein [Brevundimonas alba]NJC41154.1 putative integral membrane protein (TIGR02587 family) [Brevundimonas alba]
MSPAAVHPRRETAYARDLGRAFGGAILFSLPLLMTMEMWWFGFSLHPGRLALFLIVAAPLLVGLAYYAGFSHQHHGVAHAVLDTFVALAVGYLTAALLLTVMAIVQPDAPLRHSIGQIALQAVPGAMGALLARRQLSAGRGDGDETEARYPGELFLMVAGGLFLALNVAPTEEMILIAYRMTPWHAIALIFVSLAVMHAIVYRAGFAGEHRQESALTAFVHYTLAGYGLVLLVSVCTLWVFGRTDSHGFVEIVDAVVVLAFPGSLGAAAARLLV